MTRRARAGAEIDETELKFRTIHGYRRAYRLMGSGPALLLLHGIGDSSEGWRPLMPALAEHFTVIAPDLLGHGASAKPRADYSVAAYANGMHLRAASAYFFVVLAACTIGCRLLTGRLYDRFGANFVMYLAILSR